MIFSGHSRSLHLLRSSSDESLATPQDTEAKGPAQHHISPQTNTTSCADKTTPWFVPKASDTEAPQIEPRTQTEWPNGPPPSGPKSHRVAISPPAIRRSSSEYESSRRVSDNDPPTSYIRQSFPSSVQWRRTDIVTASSRDVENAVEPRAADMPVTAGETAQAVPGPHIVAGTSLRVSTCQSSDEDQQATSRVGGEAAWSGELGSGRSQAIERASEDHRRGFSMHLDAAETAHSERLLNVNSSTHLGPPQPGLQNGQSEETGSVLSDVTMSSGAAVSGRSSMTSSSRTRTCHKCNKTAQPASPLFKCSQCPRRYHRHCAAPKIPASSQAGSALDWVCKKHCVKIFEGQDVLGTANHQSSPQSHVERTILNSDSGPNGQESKDTVASSSTRYWGSDKFSTVANDTIITTAEGDIHGHPKAPADSGFRQAVRNISNQHVLSNVELPQKLNDSPTHTDGWDYGARAIKQESMGGNLSANMPGRLAPYSPQASPEYYESNVNTRGHPNNLTRETSKDNPGKPITEAATIDNPSLKPAATRSFVQNHVRGLESSPSSDTLQHKSQRKLQIDSDSDSLEEGETSISPEHFPGKGRSTSNTTTTTGRLQTFPEMVLSNTERLPRRKSLKYLTCYHWKQRGGCRYREEDCQYSHHDTGLDEGKNTTCFWWWTTGHCKKSEKECLYAHRDTGLYAKPPPGYVPQDRTYPAPYSADRFPKNIRADHYSPPLSPVHVRSPANGLAARRFPLPELIGASPSILESSWDQPPSSNTDGPLVNKAEQKTAGVDPRLLRVPSSASVLENLETPKIFLAKPEMKLTSAAAPMEPITPAPGPTNGVESPSSFNKCATCGKKVLRSASLCFTCKSIKPAISEAVVKSSLSVPETPQLNTEMTPEVEDRPTSEVVLQASPEKPLPHAANSLKRPISGSGLEGSDDKMFIKKRARIFKPSSEPRRPSLEMSPPQGSSPSVADRIFIPPRSNAVVGGITAKAPVLLDELIELERLRKQVRLLEKSNAEGQKAHEEARLSCAQEKDRADKLSEELRSLDIRHRELRNLTEEEQKKAAMQLVQGRREQNDEKHDDVARTPQIARRSKIRPNHARRQSSNDVGGLSEASLQSPLRPREMRTEKEEKKLLHEKLLRDMEARGIVFESDDDSDDVPEVPPPTPFKRPKDPFWCPPRSSRDLFEVAPQYQQENLLFDLERKRREIAARSSRKQTFGKVLALSDRERGTANVYREVDRRVPLRMVRVMVPDVSEETDPLQEAAQRREVEVEMSFEEFLGVPENAMLCTTTTGQLAYRDGALDQWGKLRRVPDDEKFEIGTRGI